MRKSVAAGGRKSLSRKSLKRQSTGGKRKSMAKKLSIKPGGLEGKKSLKSMAHARAELGSEPWIKDLMDKVVCDDQWRCNTAILEELHADHAGLVDLLNQKSMRGDRWPIRVISMDTIKERVMNHCAKGPDWTPYNALCEEIKTAAGRDFEKEIPTDLLAHMIKYIMLDFRKLDSERTVAIENETEEAGDHYEFFERMTETGRLVERDSFRELWESGGKRRSRKQSGKRASMKRKSMKRQSTGGKRQSTGGKRQSTGGKRQSTGGKRKSTGGKRQSTGGKRQSTGGKRQSTGGKRQSTGGKRQSTGGKRKSTGGKRQSTGGKRASMKRKSTGGKRQSMKRGSVKRKSTGGRKSIGGQRKSTLGKKRKGKPSSSEMNVESRLNKREVPPMDINYKEDHPLKGPQAYYVLTQMHNPNLMQTLRNLGVPISGMLLFNKTPPHAPNENVKDKFDPFRIQTTEDFFRKISDGRKKFDFNTKFNSAEQRANNFWTQFLVTSNHPEYMDAYANVINSLYTPQLSQLNLHSNTLRQDAGDLLYNDISHIMFTIHRIQELYNFYLANANVVDPTYRGQWTENDLAIYKSILDTLPQESYDVAMILDSMLAQVEYTSEGTLPFSKTKYGWYDKEKEIQHPSTAMDDKLKDLEFLHDLLREDVVDKSLKELTAVRPIYFGDLNKYTSLHLGKLGVFIREREEAVYDAFVQKRCRDVFGRDRATDVHEFHKVKLADAIGTRERRVITEWLLATANIAITNKTHKWFGGEEYVFSKCGPEPAALTLDEIEASNRGLTGDPRCTRMGCVSMQRMSDLKELYTIVDHMSRLNHFMDLPGHVLKQQLCRVMNDRDVVEQDYDSVSDASLFKCFNCFSTKIYEPHLPTPMSLKEFHAYIMEENRSWCNYWLNDIAARDAPKFFKTQLDRLRRDAEYYATPSVISEELKVYRTDFSEPYSFKEKFMKDNKPEKLQVDEPIQPRPHSSAIEGNLYDLNGQHFNVKNIKKSFLFNGGSRIGLCYDDTVLTKPKVSINVTLNKSTLVVHASLFPNTDPVRFHFELDNGIVLSFNEKKRTFREIILPEIPDSEFEDAETETKSTVAEAPSEVPTQDVPAFEDIWKPSLIKLMEWDFYELPKPDGIWQGIMYPKYVTPTEPVTEIVEVKIPPSPKRRVFVLNAFDRDSIDSSAVNKNRLAPEISFDLQISWTNGLHISHVNMPEDEYEAVGYIKQIYLNRTDLMPLIKEERYRCIANNGTVIKFLKNDKYEILYPWGTIISCEALVSESLLQEFLNGKDENEDEQEITVNQDYFKIYKSRFIPSCKVVQSTGQIWTHSYDHGPRLDFDKDEMLNVDSFFCRNTQIDRLDGTKFTFREDATLIVRFPDGTEIRSQCWVSEKEYFTEWSEEELRTWFFPEDEIRVGEEDEEEAEIENEEDENHPIDLFSLGFTVVNTAHAVYHPNYASVKCGCSKQEVFTLSMPGNTKVFVGPDGEYTITTGYQKETNIKVTHNRCYFDKLVNSRLNQRLAINYPQYMPTLAHHHLLKFIDSDLSEFNLDFLGNIYSRVPRNSNQQNFLRTRLGEFVAFSVRRDLSGLEIFEKDRLRHLIRRVKKLGGSMKRCRAALLKRTLTITPLNTASSYWIMDYPPYARKCRYYNLPSTYGDSWLFPLKKKRASRNKLDKVILFNNVKTLEIPNFKQFFTETISSYYGNLEEAPTSCSCKLRYIQDKITGRKDADLDQYFYFKPASYEYAREGKYYKRWIKDYFIPHVMKLMVVKFNLKQIFNDMRVNMKLCYHKKVPPYFESPKGAIFCIVEEIMDRVDTVIRRVNRWCSVDDILNMPMVDLTDSHLQDLVLCMNPRKENLGRLTPDQFRQMLEAARELHEYFPTMRQALDYRREAFLEEIYDDQGEPTQPFWSVESLDDEAHYTDWMTPVVKIKDSLPESVNKIKHFVREVLGESVKTTPDWLNSLDRCRIAVARAAKCARRESWREKMDEFYMPPMRYKRAVDSTIKDLFGIIIKHVLDPEWEMKLHAEELPTQKNQFQEEGLEESQ